jgi:E3 ubiquitin-protein ligase RGLG
MGLGFSNDSSSSARGESASKGTFKLIPDQYHTYDELSTALKKHGFENCDVILGIDFTGSNRDQGAKTFAGKDLHYPHETLVSGKVASKQAALHPPPPYSVSTVVAPGGPTTTPDEAIEGSEQESKNYEMLDDPSTYNPYQIVLASMSTAVVTLNPANRIYALGFGDTTTEDHSVFCLKRRANGEIKTSVIRNLTNDCQPCIGVAELKRAYLGALPHIVKSGPTSFVPLIDMVIERVKQTRRYTFLFIFGDGAVTDRTLNSDVVVRASNYPISISFVGIGDGPFDLMREFDDKLPQRQFDNWQTVEYHKKMQECGHNPLRFSVLALQEAPDQLAAIKKLKYIS